jgi:hypothetical protein
MSCRAADRTGVRLDDPILYPQLSKGPGSKVSSVLCGRAAAGASPGTLASDGVSGPSALFAAPWRAVISEQASLRSPPQGLGTSENGIVEDTKEVRLLVGRACTKRLVGIGPSGTTVPESG